MSHFLGKAKIFEIHPTKKSAPFLWPADTPMITIHSIQRQINRNCTVFWAWLEPITVYEKDLIPGEKGAGTRCLAWEFVFWISASRATLDPGSTQAPHNFLTIMHEYVSERYSVAPLESQLPHECVQTMGKQDKSSLTTGWPTIPTPDLLQHGCLPPPD